MEIVPINMVSFCPDTSTLSVCPNLVFTVVIFWKIFKFFSLHSPPVLPENSTGGDSG